MHNSHFVTLPICSDHFCFYFPVQNKLDCYSMHCRKVCLKAQTEEAGKAHGTSLLFTVILWWSVTISKLQSPSPGLDKAVRSKMRRVTEVGVANWDKDRSACQTVGRGYPAHFFWVYAGLFLLFSFLFTLYCNAGVKISSHSSALNHVLLCLFCFTVFIILLLFPWIK